MLKKYLLLVWILALSLSCTSSQETVGAFGEAGHASGTVLDRLGNPIAGARIWSEMHHDLGLVGLKALAHVEEGDCPEPTTEAEHGVCSDLFGQYQIDCDGQGPVTLKMINHHAEELPDLTANCGGPAQIHQLDVDPQPTPHDDEH